jgi:hypothetical protein
MLLARTRSVPGAKEGDDAACVVVLSRRSFPAPAKLRYAPA